MRKLPVIVFLLLWVAVGAIPSAEAMSIRVSQESSAGSGMFNYLGDIHSFETDLTMAQFYSFGTPTPYSYNGDANGGPAPEAGLSQFFLLNASDGLALTVVHDTPDLDGKLGATRGNAETFWELFGDTAKLVVADDSGETKVDGGTKFKSNHGWIEKYNDGYVIGSLDGDWSLEGQLLASAGITDWKAASSKGPSIDLKFNSERRVRLSPVAPVPEPATMILLGTGLLGLAGLSRKKFKK